MKNLILLYTLFTITCPAFGQVKVFSSYNDFINNKYDTYKSLRKADLSNNFILRDSLNQRSRIPRSSIWGYEDEKGITHRVWDGLPLKVDFSNERLVIYLVRKDETIILDDLIIPDTKNIIYFSRSLSSEVYKMNLESILAHIDLNPQEKEMLIQLDKKNRLKKKNSDTRKYYLVEAIFE